jgi:hypothetical protein
MRSGLASGLARTERDGALVNITSTISAARTPPAWPEISKLGAADELLDLELDQLGVLPPPSRRRSTTDEQHGMGKARRGADQRAEAGDGDDGDVEASDPDLSIAPQTLRCLLAPTIGRAVATRPLMGQSAAENAPQGPIDARFRQWRCPPSAVQGLCRLAARHQALRKPSLAASRRRASAGPPDAPRRRPISPNDRVGWHLLVGER